MGDSDGRGLEVGDMASDENDWISELRDSNGINAADVVVLDLARRPAVNADRAASALIVDQLVGDQRLVFHGIHRSSQFSEKLLTTLAANGTLDDASPSANCQVVITVVDIATSAH